MNDRYLLLLASILAPFWLFAQLRSPSEFLGYPHGSHFTPHHRVADYMAHVAEQSPKVALEAYGESYEGRPLLLLTISSANNLESLEAIRQRNLSRAQMLDTLSSAGTGLDKSIVWLSFGVHGNEAGATESSMNVLYELAREDNPQIADWLEEVVVLLDPALNPDGYDRYVSWYRSVAPVINTPSPATLEHQEPWPGGRVNHYLFDLNRDWAWQTQAESKARMKAYQRWMPHIHVDYHEQFPDAPYYFAPAAAPYHNYISEWQSDFQYEIGQNHARRFDERGWLYFTREVFDLFYPSYGDTYPTFNGAIGMTHEQAGHGLSGRGILMENGDTLTLNDRIAHHTVTALSTIEVAYQSKAEILAQFETYFEQAVQDPVGNYRSFVISKNNPAGKLNALTALLKQNNIRYGRAINNRRLSAFDYQKGKKGSVRLREGDLVVSAYQPQSTLAQVLFEPEPVLEDSLTYDITAWALPYAYGLEAFATEEQVAMEAGFLPPEQQPGSTVERPYAYVFSWSSVADAKFLAALLRAGVKVRSAAAAFGIEGNDYEGGTLIVTRADNRKLANFDDLVVQIAAAHKQPAKILQTGFSDEGFDLGSANMTYLEPPRAALLSGDGVNANSYGQVWHFFEQVLEYPIFLLEADRLPRLDWDDYNVLILAEGNYNFSEATLEQLQAWINEGGRLIAIGGALRALTGQPGFSISRKERERPEQPSAPYAYASASRREAELHVPGAIFPVQVDTTHPLAFGLSTPYYSLKTSGRAFELLETGWSVGYLPEQTRPIGFAGSKAVEQLQQTLVFGIENKGRGAVVYLIDNPLYRGFWEEGKLLFSNALFLGGQ